MKKKQEIKGSIIIAEDAVPLTPDLACKIFFGKSIEELAIDIRCNKDGKYNDWFLKEEENSKREE